MQRITYWILATAVLLWLPSAALVGQQTYRTDRFSSGRFSQPRPAVVTNPQAPSRVGGRAIRTHHGSLSAGFAAPPEPLIAADALSRFNFSNPSLDLLRQLGEQRPPLKKGQAYQRYPRLSGEFERQKAMLLSISDLQTHHHNVLKQLIQKTAGRLPLVILVNDTSQLKTAVELAESAKVDLSHVKFFIFDLNTIWLRDFGPRFIETENGTRSIDFYYDGTRPKDDQFPNKWGEITGVKNKTIEWTLQGGNLISNGRGIAITSTRFFEDNYVRFPTANKPRNIEYERRKLVVNSFKTECNIDRLLFLKPLKPEATKHVDMFAKFLAADHILIARVDPRLDPVNAQILNENAAFLSTVVIDGKPLRVDRIDVPPRQGKYWSPYTNTIFANDLVLLPVYQGDSPQLVQNAIRTYRRLLPNKHVDTIDLTSMKKLEGALHCMSINVPEYVDLPEGLLTADQARQIISGERTWQPPKQLLVNKNVREQRDRHLYHNRHNSGQPVRRKSQQPVMITGQVVSDDQPTSQVNTSNATNRQSSQFAAKQRAAVQTYRRVFRDQSGSFSMDAVAVATKGPQVYLMRASDGKIFQIAVQRLNNDDQVWINRNREFINTNGPSIQQFVSKHGIN